MAILLVLVSLVIGAAGLLFLSNATVGVGLIAFACLLAIYARIAQVWEHRRDAREEASMRAASAAPQAPRITSVTDGRAD